MTNKRRPLQRPRQRVAAPVLSPRWRPPAKVVERIPHFMNKGWCYADAVDIALLEESLEAGRDPGTPNLPAIAACVAAALRRVPVASVAHAFYVGGVNTDGWCGLHEAALEAADGALLGRFRLCSEKGCVAGSPCWALPALVAFDATVDTWDRSKSRSGTSGTTRPP